MIILFYILLRIIFFLWNNFFSREDFFFHTLFFWDIYFVLTLSSRAMICERTLKIWQNPPEKKSPKKKQILIVLVWNDLSSFHSKISKQFGSTEVQKEISFVGPDPNQTRFGCLDWPYGKNFFQPIGKFLCILIERKGKNFSDQKSKKKNQKKKTNHKQWMRLSPSPFTKVFSLLLSSSPLSSFGILQTFLSLFHSHPLHPNYQMNFFYSS